MQRSIERNAPWVGFAAVVSCLALGCNPDRGSQMSADGTGGQPQPGSGGSSGTGGTGSGGASGGSTGGVSGTGGMTGTGGVTGAGGGPGIGGAAGTGGARADGGMTGSGGFGGPSYPYILSCFNDAAPLSDLVVYKSDDALNWTLLYDTGYVGPTGFMRDPSIMRHTDGKYYVAFTTPPNLGCCGAEQNFAVGSSSNLKDWTTIAVVPCGVAGTVNTWSPEWFVDSDGSVHLTVTLDLKTYRYEPTDATLTKWGPGKPIGISGTIDTQIIKIGSTYHAIIPNKHATASSLDGPWTYDNLLPPQCKEGPAIVHIGGDTWRYYCDDGGNGHERSSLTTDLLKTWTTLATLPVVGNNISQGTVIRGDTGHPF